MPVVGAVGLLIAVAMEVAVFVLLAVLYVRAAAARQERGVPQSYLRRTVASGPAMLLRLLIVVGIVSLFVRSVVAAWEALG